MTECYLKGKPWTLSGTSYCYIFIDRYCKICNLPICNTHSLPFGSPVGIERICDSCTALRLPDKTDGDMVGKDYFTDSTIRRAERLYLTTTKACKQ